MKIAKVLLPANIKQADDDYDAVDWLGRFCGKLVLDGPYDWDDLPPIARAICELDEYAGEVANGGHMQYLTNHHWKADEVAACREGLRLLAANPFQAIFDAASEVIEHDRDWLERFRAGDPDSWNETTLNSIEAQLTPLDHRFFRDAGGPGALHRLMRAALFASDDVGYSENVSKEIKALLPSVAAPVISRDLGETSVHLAAPIQSDAEIRKKITLIARGACRQMGCDFVSMKQGYHTVHSIQGKLMRGLTVETKQGDKLLLFAGDEILFVDFKQDKMLKFNETFFDHSKIEGITF